MERVLALLREVEPLAVALGDPWRLGQVSVFRSHDFRSMGIYDPSSALGQDADFLPNFHGLAADLRVAYSLGGRVSDAVPLLDQVQIRDTPGRGGSSPMLQLGDASLAIGRLSDAFQLAERVLRLANGRKERSNQAWALRLRGEIAMPRWPPERDQAEAAFLQALTLAEALGVEGIVPVPTMGNLARSAAVQRGIAL